MDDFDFSWKDFAKTLLFINRFAGEIFYFYLVIGMILKNEALGLTLPSAVFSVFVFSIIFIFIPHAAYYHFNKVFK